MIEQFNSNYNTLSRFMYINKQRELDNFVYKFSATLHPIIVAKYFQNNFLILYHIIIKFRLLLIRVFKLNEIFCINGYIYINTTIATLKHCQQSKAIIVCFFFVPAHIYYFCVYITTTHCVKSSPSLQCCYLY